MKICGINSAAAFDAACEAGADWVGFVFFAPSPRNVTPAQAAALSARSQGGPVRVGLFVSPSDDDIAAARAALPLAILQIYADPSRAADLRARLALPVWRAVGVARPDELPTSLGGVDALLIEAKPPPQLDRPGGHGTPVDWTLLAGWKAPGPWLLAGGLTPDNVQRAIGLSGAAAVDVSSGVEIRPGEKDPALIRRFVEAVRSA